MTGIRRLVPGAKLEPLVCDLSDQSSIRAAADFVSRHDRLDVLVNAADVFRKDRHVTRDGIELTFATRLQAASTATFARRRPQCWPGSAHAGVR